jgi:hypothetical protein
VSVDLALALVAATGSPAGPRAADPLLTIETLARVGLLQPLETASGRRFSMLRTVRSVAGAAERTARVVDVVAEAWLELDQRRDPIKDWSPERIADLDDDLPILRQVVRELAAAGRAVDAARLLLARRRGLFQLGRQDLVAELGRSLLAAGLPPPWSARTAVVAGGAAYATYAPDAGTLLAAVEDLAPDDALHRVLGYSFRSCHLAVEGDAAAARSDADAAVDEAARDPALLQIAHSSAAWTALVLDDPGSAVEHAQICVELAEDDLQGLIAVQDLAQAELFGDGAVRALTLLQEALPRARRTGSTKARLGIELTLAFALIRVGQAGPALDLLLANLPQVAGMSDVGYTLEVVAATGIAVRLCATEEARKARADRLMQAATKRAQALGLGDDAVPGELSVVASAFARSAAEPMLVPQVPELVEQAGRLAREAIADLERDGASGSEESLAPGVPQDQL